MKVGIAFDLKADAPAPPDRPDDFQEEFDSPVTIDALADVLRGLGHDVILLGDGRGLIEKLLADPPDLVFNTAEGEGVSRSREARVPAVLEMLGIPYTGSDPLTLAVTLDKDCAKRLVASAGVPVPKGVVVATANSKSAICHLQSAMGLGWPVIVKPAWEGSSKGIRGKSVVDRPEDLPAVIDSLCRDHRQPVLVEEYIQGDELTVGVLGNDPPRVMGVMRVVPAQPTDRFVYSLEVKRDYLRQVRYECPPPYPKEVLARIEEAALGVYRVLGCRDVSRIDFRLRDGVPYFLEVNPLPGLNPESSDLVIMGRLCGWSHARIIETIFRSAVARLQPDQRS